MAISLRKSSDNGTVGLDIDGRYVAAASVRDGKVANVASAELPAGALADGEVVDRAALTAALKDFVDANKIPRRVLLGVSNQQIVVRVIDLPRIDDPSERDAALRFSAADAIAMPLDEAVLDHQIAGYRTGEGGERMQVVVVAARRTMIEEYLGAARDAGLKPEGIDLDAFALVRMLAGEAVAPLPAPPEPDPLPEPAQRTDSVAADAGLADATPSGLDPAVLEAMAAHAALEEPAPPAPTTPPAPADAVAAATAPVPAPVAPRDDDRELARVFCHLGGVSNLAIALGSSCFFCRTLSTRFDAEGAGPRLADEIRLSIDYYMAQPGATPVGDVLLSGDGARDAALVAAVAGQLGIPVGAANPLGALDAAAVADGEAHRYTVAAGLALGAAA